MALVDKRKQCVENDSNCLRDYFFDARLECYKPDKKNGCKNTLQYWTADYLKNPREARPRNCSEFRNDKNDHQQWVECYQDILSPFPGGIGENKPVSYLKMIPETIFELGTTAAFLPFHHLTNAFFDWRLKFAPTQWAYEAGILRTYSYEPSQTKPKKELLVEFMPSIQDYSFANLRSLYERNAVNFVGLPMPIWIMNATTPDNGTWWAKKSANLPYDLNNNIFEIGPFHFGAGMFNYVHGSPEIVGLDVPTAVAASAAFFDASKRDFFIPPTAAYLLLFHTNLSWGLEYLITTYQPGSAYPTRLFLAVLLSARCV